MGSDSRLADFPLLNPDYKLEADGEFFALHMLQ